MSFHLFLHVVICYYLKIIIILSTCGYFMNKHRVPSRNQTLMTLVISIWRLNIFLLPHFQGKPQCHTDLVMEHYSKCRTPSQYLCIGTTCVSLPHRVHYFQSLRMNHLFGMWKMVCTVIFYIMCCNILRIWRTSQYMWINCNSKVFFFNAEICFTFYIISLTLCVCRVGTGWCKWF
jgi:hypothetical protein